MLSVYSCSCKGVYGRGRFGEKVFVLIHTLFTSSEGFDNIFSFSPLSNSAVICRVYEKVSRWNWKDVLVHS